jgi:hypothetical protein
VKAWILAAVVGVAACTPIEGIERFDGEFARAKEKRRVLALASPT